MLINCYALGTKVKFFISGGRGGFELKTPPQGYVCYRCKVPGMHIR